MASHLADAIFPYAQFANYFNSDIFNSITLPRSRALQIHRSSLSSKVLRMV